MEAVSEYFKKLQVILIDNNWSEPTEKQYPTYTEAYKKNGNRAKAPYFEDIHFVWRNCKPINA